MSHREELRRLLGARLKAVSYAIQFAELAGGNIVGAVSANVEEYPIGRLVFSTSPEHALIQTVTVRDDYQRRGIGSGLYNYFEQWLLARGVPEVVAGYVDSPQAEAFWRSLDFQRINPGSKDWSKRVGG